MTDWNLYQPILPYKLNTPVEVEKIGHVGILTLNNPSSLNTLDNAEDKLLYETFTKMKEDLDIRVIVITGAGRAFSAGANTKDWRAREIAYDEKGGRPPQPTLIMDGTRMEFLGLENIFKPTIAMVNGPAVGQGADLALACDMRVMSDNAFLQWAYILNGICPKDGGCWYLTRLIGEAKAMELLLTGDRVYADEALRLGIVNHVVPLDQLRGKTLELANKIANGPWNAVQVTRMMVKSALHDTLRESLDKSYLATHVEGETSARGFKAKGEKKQADFRDM